MKTQSALLYVCAVVATVYCGGMAAPPTPDPATNDTVTDTNTTTADNSTTTSSTSLQDSNTLPERNRMFGRLLRCYIACKHSTPPSFCNCNQMTCETKQCGEGKKCRIMMKRIPVCVTDDAVCDLPRATRACNDAEPGFYFDTATDGCVQYSTGECADNLNVFPNRFRCLSTCKGRRGPRRGMRKGSFRRPFASLGLLARARAGVPFPSPRPQ